MVIKSAVEDDVGEYQCKAVNLLTTELSSVCTVRVIPGLLCFVCLFLSVLLLLNLIAFNQ